VREKFYSQFDKISYHFNNRAKLFVSGSWRFCLCSPADLMFNSEEYLINCQEICISPINFPAMAQFLTLLQIMRSVQTKNQSAIDILQQ